MHDLAYSVRHVGIVARERGRLSIGEVAIGTQVEGTCVSIMLPSKKKLLTRHGKSCTVGIIA